ncbi:hypothetical protein E0K83_05925 [Gramella sp. BOM4]|nr:hypothetical protein [Christiangramia bathymodioli]
MKKFIGFLFTIILLSACQDEDRKELMDQPETEKVPDSIQVLEGDFVLGSNTAVLRGADFVYAVAVDSMSRVLARKIEPLKQDDFDMIPVRVKAKIELNPSQEGLEEMIRIQEILEVPESEEKDTIEEQ